MFQIVEVLVNVLHHVLFLLAYLDTSLVRIHGLQHAVKDMPIDDVGQHWSERIGELEVVSVILLADGLHAVWPSPRAPLRRFKRGIPQVVPQERVPVGIAWELSLHHTNDEQQVGTQQSVRVQAMLFP